jgi:cytochrome oxidase Cu insertion factor (SCO1/SenC/PrrC family)
MRDNRGSTVIEPWALTALIAWLAITIGWWALALWPLPGESPEWLTRARVACFNTTETGLPDASGWLLLIGQPIGMLGVLAVAWPRSLQSTLTGLRRRPVGRVALVSSGLIVVVGLLAAGVRVADARASSVVRIQPDARHPEGQPRMESMPAALDLVDQHGRRVGLADFGGRPVLLTFAFGHCETVCPVVVRNANAARASVAEDARPVLLVVTLDPWRDTPARLEHLATTWELGTDGFALGGTVAEVNATLDGWEIQRSRDERTGDIIHAPVVYVLDRDGRIAFVSTGEIRSLTELVERL